MSSFNVSEYVNYVENRNDNTQSKVGFFKLEIGKSALVRFNISSLEDIYGAWVHTYPSKDGKLETCSCLGKEQCPLCQKGIKASRRGFIQLLVSYKNSDGQSECQSVVWGRPMSFVQMINKKLMDFTDLRNIVFRVDRIDKNTYNVEYIPQKPDFDELLPKDFSLFEGYNYEGRAIRNKTYEELEDIANRLLTHINVNVVKTNTISQESKKPNNEFEKAINNSINNSTPDMNWSF